METKDKVQQILDENLYLTVSVATLTGEPWIANLYYVVDSNYTFYWYSSKNTKHSELIRQNPKVALCIFNSTATEDDVDAVYVKALAFEMSDISEIAKSLLPFGKKMLATGFVNGKDALNRFVSGVKDFTGESALRLYKADPLEIYKLAPSQEHNGKYIDSRIRIEI